MGLSWREGHPNGVFEKGRGFFSLKAYVSKERRGARSGKRKGKRGTGRPGRMGREARGQGKKRRKKKKKSEEGKDEASGKTETLTIQGIGKGVKASIYRRQPAERNRGEAGGRTSPQQL